MAGEEPEIVCIDDDSTSAVQVGPKKLAGPNSKRSAVWAYFSENPDPTKRE